MSTDWWEPNHYADLAKAFREGLKEVGYSLPRTCRISQLIDIVLAWPEVVAYGPALSSERVRQTHSCLAELQLLAPVLHMLRKDASVWWPTFKRAYSGPLSFDDETVESTDARNAQFELYVAALLSIGGFRIRLEEPDIVTSWRRVEFGVACKRVQTENGFDKAMKSARRQIERSGRPGIIAVDLTPAVRRGGNDRVSTHGDPAGEYLREGLCHFDDAFRANMRQDERSVLASIAFLHMRTVSHDIQSVGTHSSTRLVPNRLEEDSDMPWIDGLSEGLHWASKAKGAYTLSLVGRSRQSHLSKTGRWPRATSIPPLNGRG